MLKKKFRPKRKKKHNHICKFSALFLVPKNMIFLKNLVREYKAIHEMEI